MPKGFKGFQKGYAPWHKGKTGVYSKEVLQRMSKAHKGKKQSAIAIEKTRLSNIGRKVSEKTKKKISLALKGKKVSEETRRRMSMANIRRIKEGKHHLWKGGISYEPYSADWTETLRRSIRERDNYICQLCSRYGNTIHHIDYDKKNCNPTNLITLCNGCNLNVVNRNREKWTRFFQKLREDIEEILN